MIKNKLLRNAIWGITASGLTNTSCTYDNDSLRDKEYEELIVNDFNDKGNSAITISFSKEEVEYLNFLNKLGYDIMHEPAVAKHFAKDPSEFLKSYGYNGIINFDDSMIKLMLSLGDAGINNAIKEQDISEALELMNRKGILNDVDYSQLTVQLSNEEIISIYREMGINIPTRSAIGPSYNSVAVAAVLVYAVLGVISQVGIVYNAGIALNAAVSATVYLWVEAWGKSQDTPRRINQNFSLEIQNLKGQDHDSFVTADKRITLQAKKITELIKEKNPQISDYINDEQIEQIIKINLIMSKQ